MFVIKFLGYAGEHPSSAMLSRLRGQYLKSTDFEANAGVGHTILTKSVSEAMTFPTTDAAVKFYNTQSRSRPLRDDGEPNRPLTAFCVYVCEVKVIAPNTQRRPS